MVVGFWVSSMTLLFYYLAPPAKRHLRDVTMHAVHFWGQGSSYLFDQRVPCLGVKKKGRGEKEHQPLDEIWTCKPQFICSYTNTNLYDGQIQRNKSEQLNTLHPPLVYEQTHCPRVQGNLKIPCTLIFYGWEISQNVFFFNLVVLSSKKHFTNL